MTLRQGNLEARHRASIGGGKMKRFVLGAALVVLTTDAFGQRVEKELGSNIPIPYRARVPDRASLSGEERGRLAMVEFASCVLDRNPVGVAKTLSFSDEEEQNRGWAKLATDECLFSGIMRFQPAVMRGALFVEGYRRREKGSRSLFAVSPYDLTRSQTASDDMRVYWWLMSFADCVVGADRSSAERFVIAPAVSGPETAALKPLAPLFGPCVPRGQSVTLNRAVIKGALAEALYRGQKPESPAATSGGKK